MPSEPKPSPPEDPKPPAPGREAIAAVSEEDDDQITAQAEAQLGHASRSHVVTEELADYESAATPPEAKKPAEEPGDDGDDDDGDAGEEPKAASADADADTAAAGAGDEGAEGSDGQDGDKPPKSRRARKTARLQRELAAANARISALEADAREAPPAKQEPTPEPEADDYPSWDEYAEAKGQWIADKKISEAQAGGEGDGGDVVLPASWGDVSDKYDDFDKVIRGNHPVTQTMTEQLIGMEAEGAEVAYFLGQHPDEAKRIASVSGEIAVARELAKLVEKTSTGTPKGTSNQPGNGQAANVAPTVSNAPEPIIGTEGGGAQGRVADLNTADPEEFRAIRRKQMSERG